MKTKNIFLPIALLLFATLACKALSQQTEATPTAISIATEAQPPKSGIPLTEADVPRIDVKEAKAALDAGQAILIDVRNVDAYAESHAQGAISIPLEKFEFNIANLSLEKSQWIITYCT